MMYMVDITGKMLKFKESIRHIWNSCFLEGNDPASSEMQNAFSDIEHALLRALVLAPYGMGNLAESYRLQVLSNILVQPLYFSEEIPIRFGNIEQNGNVVWDVEAMLKVEKNTQFHFFDFFDWYPYGYVDLPFVRVRTVPDAGDPAGGGKIALIEQRYCKFMLVAAAKDDMTGIKPQSDGSP